VLSVWSPSSEMIARGTDVGMTAAIAKAALLNNTTVTVSGDDGRCVLVTTDAGVTSLADHSTNGWPSSLSRALTRLTSQPTRYHNNIPPH
jgi:predicted secreted Zn-dependent protease